MLQSCSACGLPMGISLAIVRTWILDSTGLWSDPAAQFLSSYMESPSRLGLHKGWKHGRVNLELQGKTSEEVNSSGDKCYSIHLVEAKRDLPLRNDTGYRQVFNHANAAGLALHI